MRTLRNLIGVGVVTGVVLYAYMRSLTSKLDRGLPEGEKASPQLV